MWPRGAGREQTWPALPPQRLTDPLVGRPRLASGAGHGEPHSLQAILGREVGDLESRIDFPGPQVARHLLVGRDARFGQVPIPLGPHRCLVTGEIQPPNGRTVLPATVR